MPYLYVDTLNGGTVSATTWTELKDIPDAQLEACLNKEATIIKWTEENGYEQLEFIGDVMPNWVPVPELEG